MLYVAAFLLFAIGVAHSVLGERFILMRLFRRDSLPKLFGGTEFTQNTLRFAWHVTTVCWWAFAAILISLADPGFQAATIALIVGCAFLIHFAIALIASRGRHLSWIVFLAVGVIAVYFGLN